MFSNRVRRPVQIATDNLPAYAFHIREHFGYEGYNYGTETKIFGEPKLLDGTLARLGKNEGVRKMQTAERKAVIGSPDLESLTTWHIERAFLTVRQELKRFERKGLGYSKDLETHKLAVALHFGVYNFVRKHHTLGTTPAVAAGLGRKAVEFRTGRGNDGGVLEGKMNRTQHPSILYDIYCLMLLKEWAAILLASLQHVFPAFVPCPLTSSR